MATEQQMDNRRTWLEALRSGKYSQAKHQLRFTNEAGEAGYCCLGVACELAGDLRPAGSDAGEYKYVGGDVFPSELWIADRFGLTPEQAFIFMRNAAGWNDARAFSFGVIADLVDQYFNTINEFVRERTECGV